MDVEVIVACEDVLIVVDSYEAAGYNPDIGFVTKMAVTQNNELIAAYTQDDALVVLSAGLSWIAWRSCFDGLGF